jgi:hypothetical protein
MENEIGSALMAAGFARAMVCAGPAPDTLQIGVQWPGQRRYTFINGHAADSARPLAEHGAGQMPQALARRRLDEQAASMAGGLLVLARQMGLGDPA